MRSGTRRVIVVVAAVALLAPTFAWAQTTSGSIRGTVTDPEGGVMPGATVVAFSDALVAGQTVAIAGSSGNYRFPSLPPGKYAIEAQLAGFQTVRREDITLLLGQTLDVDLQLGDPEFTEEIVVVAETVQVSTVSNSVAHNLDQEFMERQPLTRDPTGLMNYAPGINDDQAYGAPTSAVNSYNLDGVDVSDPALGTQWVLPSMDWVQEVQVLGLGADAEYGGFTGAAVNLITKSGGNDFSGDVRVFYSDDGLNSSTTPEDTVGEFAQDDLDVSFSLGGPIIRDRVWFFLSGNERERGTSPFYLGGAPLDDRAETTRSWSRYLGKVTFQANASNRIVGLVNYDAVDEDYRGVGDLTLASASERQDSPNYSYNLTWESLVSDSSFITAKITGFDGNDDRFPQSGDIPGRYDLDSGFGWVNAEIIFDNIEKSRLAFDASWSLFADGLLTENDAHNFKFGVTYETLDDVEHETRPGGFTYADDSYWCADLDEYFANPDCALFSSDRGGLIDLAAEMDGLHLFAQDSWQTGNVTVNLGVRYSQYTGNFNDPVSEPTSGGSDVYDVDMIAPRVGVVWDLFGDGTTAVKAHYGQYHEGMAVVVFDREASGAAFSDLEFWDWDSDADDWVFYSSRPTGGARMDPDVNHPYVEQFVATFERQLGQDMLIGVDYIHRENKDILAMVTANVEDYDALVAPDNPLTGGNTPFFELLEPQDFLITNPDSAERVYDSVALRFAKRYRDGWSLDASLVWSDLTGNIDYGLAGYSDDFEDLNGQVNADGRLPFNSEWVLKISGSVDLPWGFMLSGFYQYRTGEYWTPYARVYGLLENDRTDIYMEERGSRQYDDRDVLDLHLEKAFSLGSRLELTLMVDAFNVLDSDEITSVSQRWGDYDYVWDAHPEESGWFESSSFGSTLSVQRPREIRLGARLAF
jgi:hypothetical protein